MKKFAPSLPDEVQGYLATQRIELIRFSNDPHGRPGLTTLLLTVLFLYAPMIRRTHGKDRAWFIILFIVVVLTLTTFVLAHPWRIARYYTAWKATFEGDWAPKLPSWERTRLLRRRRTEALENE